MPVGVSNQELRVSRRHGDRPGDRSATMPVRFVPMVEAPAVFADYPAVGQEAAGSPRSGPGPSSFLIVHAFEEQARRRRRQRRGSVGPLVEEAAASPASAPRGRPRRARPPSGGPSARGSASPRSGRGASAPSSAISSAIDEDLRRFLVRLVRRERREVLHADERRAAARASASTSSGSLIHHTYGLKNAVLRRRSDRGSCATRRRAGRGSGAAPCRSSGCRCRPAARR